MSGLSLVAFLALGLVPGTGPLDVPPGLPEQDLAAGPAEVSIGDEGVAATTDVPLPVPVGLDTSFLPCAACPVLSIEAGRDAAGEPAGPSAQKASGPLQALHDVPDAALFAGSSFLASALAAGLWALRPALGLFSRIEDGDLAGHPLRRQALDYIAANPGATVQDVRRSLGVAWGTAVYHLGRLERAGQVAVRHVAGHRGHWPIGQAPSRDALAPTGQALASLVREKPGLSQLELARLAGIGAPAACKQLRRLEQAGAILGERAGRVRLYRPAERLDAMLAV